MISHSVIVLTNLKEYVNIGGKHSLFMHLLMVLRRFSHVVHSSWIILNGYWMEWFSGMELLELPSCYCWFVWSHSPMLVAGSAELCSLMVLHHHQSTLVHWLSYMVSADIIMRMYTVLVILLMSVSYRSVSYPWMNCMIQHNESPVHWINSLKKNESL